MLCRRSRLAYVRGLGATGKCSSSCAPRFARRSCSTALLPREQDLSVAALGGLSLGSFIVGFLGTFWWERARPEENEVESLEKVTPEVVLKASEPEVSKLPAAFIEELSARLGDRFTLVEALREEYSRDPSFHAASLPDAVAFPSSTEEVQALVKVCHLHKVPIVPYGQGTSLEGHTNAEYGGIVVSLRLMDQVLAVHDRDMDAVVQPGMTYDDLNAELKKYNLFFPVDPGPGAVLGGMAGTGSAGSNAMRYGTMRENVLSMKVVTPDGRVVKTGQRARKSSAGYDLSHLFIGSEGTLGIITELTLRLRNLPEHKAVGTCTFDSLGDASNLVIEAMQMGLGLGKVELLDDVMIEAINLSAGTKESVKPTLFFEFSGTKNQVNEQEEVTRILVEKYNGGRFRYAEGEEADTLWSVRKNALWHAHALRPEAEMIITDVCVPISQLAHCISETRKDINQSKFIAPIVGHVGDGNFHVFILVNLKDEKELEEAGLLNKRLVERAISLDGTCTGEHGIGMGKREFLLKELGQDAIDTMRAIKKAIDPNDVMNPGKIV